MPKYRHTLQNSECDPHQVMPWYIRKAETKILEKYTVNSAVAMVDKCLKTSLCSPLNVN